VRDKVVTARDRAERSRRSHIAIFATVTYAVLGAIVLVTIYALTPRESRVVVLNAYAPAVIAGIPGLWAWLRSRAAARSADSTQKALNGGFDDRIKSQVHEALDERQVDE
jgi:amino acid permease